MTPLADCDGRQACWQLRKPVGEQPEEGTHAVHDEGIQRGLAVFVRRAAEAHRQIALIRLASPTTLHIRAVLNRSYAHSEWTMRLIVPLLRMSQEQPGMELN